jgi:hypothetical protein
VVKLAASQRRILSFQVSLFHGLTGSDIARLYSFTDIASSSSVFHLPSCSIMPFDAKIAPWPLAWISSSRNRKFIQCPARAPSIVPVACALRRFVNRFSWQVKLRDAPRDAPTIAKYRGAPVAPCRLEHNLPLECWKSRLIAVAMKKVEMSRRSNLHCGSNFSNVTFLDQVCGRLLRTSCWCLVARDKGCGYVLHRKCDLTTIHRSILFGSSEYTAVPSPDWNTVKSAYVSHVGDVVSSFFPSEHRVAVRAQLLRSLIIQRSSPTAVLKITCKDHKRPTEHRNLHSAPVSQFSGLSQFVKHVLGQYLQQQQHIVRDARHLMREIVKVVAPDNVRLYRIDLKRFFMSGEPNDLAHICSSIFNGVQRRDFEGALLFLLYHQYITSEELPDFLFRAILGTGMGLKHSSEVANTALCIMAEVNFAASKAIQSRFKMVGYWWYFDDIIVASTSVQLFSSFYREFVTRCRFFRPELIEASAFGVDFLNVHVFIHDHSFHTRTIFKPSSLSVPLTPDSAHAPHVHRWPLGTLRTLLRLCSRNVDAEAIGSQFVCRFSKYNQSPTLIRALEQIVIDHCKGSCSRTQKSSVGKNIQWIVLPFHPLWLACGLHKSILSFINSIDSQLALQSGGIGETSFRISWKNHMLPNMHLLSRRFV